MTAAKKGLGVGSSQQGRGATASPQDQMDHAERVKQVVSLRLAGATFQQIADRVGYSQPANAYKAWQRAMADIPRSVVDEARRLEEARLDTMLTAVWPAVLRGQLGAIDRALNIGRRRARLLGLDAPLKVDGTFTEGVDAEVAALAHALDSIARQGVSSAEDLAAANQREG